MTIHSVPWLDRDTTQHYWTTVITDPLGSSGEFASHSQVEVNTASTTHNHSLTYSVIIRQHRWKQFHLLVLKLPFRGLSVTFVHCVQMAEDIDTISFAHVSPMYLPDWVKNLAYIGRPFLPKFCPKVTHPYWFQQWRYLMVNCDQMVWQSAMLTMETV